jgi:hypothetical protein
MSCDLGFVVIVVVVVVVVDILNLNMWLIE